MSIQVVMLHRLTLTLCLWVVATRGQLQIPGLHSRFQRPVICEYDFLMRDPNGAPFTYETLPLEVCNRIALRGLAFSGNIDSPIEFTSGATSDLFMKVVKWRNQTNMNLKILPVMHLDALPDAIQKIAMSRTSVLANVMARIADWIVANGFDGLILRVDSAVHQSMISAPEQNFNWGIDNYTPLHLSDQYAFNIHRRLWSENLEAYTTIIGTDPTTIAAAYNVEVSWSYGGPRFILLTDTVTLDYPRCSAAWGNRDHPTENTVGSFYTRVMQTTMDTIPYKKAFSTQYKKRRPMTADQYSRMVLLGISVKPTIAANHLWVDEYSDSKFSVDNPLNMCQVWQASSNTTTSMWSECEMRACANCHFTMSTLSTTIWGEKLIYSYPSIYGVYIRDINLDDPNSCSGVSFPQSRRVAQVFGSMSVALKYC